MKTLKKYLALLTAMCMITAACPAVVYASSAEYDDADAVRNDALVVTESPELTEDAEEQTLEELAEGIGVDASALREGMEENAVVLAEEPAAIAAEEIASEAEEPTVAPEITEDDVAGTDEMVGAPSKTVGTNVTATFDASSGEVVFSSNGGTLWKDWVNKSGFGADNIKYIWISGTSGPVKLPEDASGIFAGLKNLTSLDLRGFDSSDVTDMQNMFKNCNKLEMLNLSCLDTSNVKNMSSMFQGCQYLTELDLRSLDISKVRFMNHTFDGCTRLHKLRFPSTVTQMVNHVIGMFAGCKSLATIDLSSFNFSKTYEVDSMFSGCESLMIMKTPIYCTYDIDLPVTMYNSSGTAYNKLPKYIESSCFLTKSKKIPEGFLVGDGVTATLKNGHVTFYSDGGTLWNNWIEMSGIGANNIKSFSVGTASGSVYLPEDSYDVFAYCTKLTGPDLSKFNTSKVKSLHGMFYHCESLTSLDLSGFNSSNVENMGNLFDGCTALTTLNLDGFITGKTTSMYRMFAECEKLKNIAFGKVDTSHVQTLHFTFSGCKSLTSLDLSTFDTSSMDSMYYTFNGCIGLTSLDLSGWNTANVGRMGSMFSGCSGLTELDLSSFDLSKLSESPNYMFSECNNLSILKTPKNNTDGNIALPHTMYDSSGKSYSKLPILTKSIVLGITAKAAKDYEEAHAGSGTGTLKFKDVTDPTHPYYKAIYWAAEKGITKGYSDGTFGIDKACTRGHSVMFLWNMAGRPAPKNVSASPFSDVPKTHSYFKAVLWAQQRGITKGYTSGANKGKFGVNDTCTRGQIMTFIWRYKGQPAPKGTSKSPFSDVPTTHAFYKAICWGAQNGVTKGYTSGPNKGKFGINDSCTRGQIVKFLYNIR